VSNNKTALRLATGEKAPSPERAALAKAIEKFNADNSAVETLQAAVSYARDGIRAARSIADKAEAALEAVKSERAAHLVSQAKKGETPSVQNTSRERADFQVALDEVEVAFSAEANLSAELTTARGKLNFSESQLKARVLDVIKSDPETRDFLIFVRKSGAQIFAGEGLPHATADVPPRRQIRACREHEHRYGRRLASFFSVAAGVAKQCRRDFIVSRVVETDTVASGPFLRPPGFLTFLRRASPCPVALNSPGRPPYASGGSRSRRGWLPATPILLLRDTPRHAFGLPAKQSIYRGPISIISSRKRL
jgi:hypothetical protein